jgi:iron(III) transport system permease protein
MTALFNSLLIAFFSTALACVLGLLAAFSLFAASPRPRIAVSLLALCVLPFLVPNYVVVSFWMEALGTNGWLALLLNNGTAISLTGFWPTIFVLSLIYWSPVALVCWFTLGRIDRAMIEAAELALAKRRAAVQVIAPMLWPSIAIGAALVFVLTFSNFSVPAIFLVNTIQSEIYVQFVTNFEVGRAFVFALPQVIAALALLWAVGRVLRSRPWIAVSGRSVGVAALLRSAESSNGLRFTEARLQRLLGIGLLTGLLTLSAIGPGSRSVAAVFHGKVLWQTLIVSAHQIWNSFWFSFLAATIVTALSLLVVAADVRSRTWAHRQLPLLTSRATVLLLPFVLPEVLIGITLIAILNRPSLQFIYTSVAIVLIAFVVRYFIVGKLAVSVGRSHLDPSLFESAELAGLPRCSILLRIQLPLLSRWLFAGWWLVYLFCLADVGSLVLIYPPGCDTVPIRIFNLLHYGYDAQVSALCLVMLVLGAVPMVLLPRISRMVTND